MNAWLYLSMLGNLGITVPGALIIAAWLAGAQGARLAMLWCCLFSAALTVSAGSQIAFIGWGVGVKSLAFTGFSGHATRAAAVYPIAAFILVRRESRPVQWAGMSMAILVAIGVAIARVEIGAHSPSEAITGFLLGMAAAGICMTRLRATPHFAVCGLPAGLVAALALLPCIIPASPHQWLTTVALALSHSGRPHLRSDLHRLRPQDPAYFIAMPDRVSQAHPP